MARRLGSILFAVIVIMIALSEKGPTALQAAPAEVGVRKPAVAGQFYPSDPEKLARAIDAYLETAVAPSVSRPIALVCPHAGYIFSGQIAADAYKQASKFDYDLVVILGVNHTTAGFRDISIYAKGGFETPLGVAPIDEKLAGSLASLDKRYTTDEVVHTREHSIEVQVPFVQKVFPKARILPVVVGSPDPAVCAKFGEALAGAVAGRRVLIVASSDLSHFPGYDDANRADRKTLEAIASLDAETFVSVTSKQLAEGTRELETCACGEAAILVAMAAAKKLGATGARVVSYSNSGATLVGDPSRVVGYGAVAFTAGKGPGALSGLPIEAPAEKTGAAGAPFTTDEKEALLSFARETIRRYLSTETVPLARDFAPALRRKTGAFVTLKKKGDLRGCIGHMAQDTPLCQVVGFCALQAAFNDRRFQPVDMEELGEIEIEISVLTPYRRVGGYRDVVIGRDGVVLEKDGRSAVFLPSVAVEQGWGRDEMLSHLSIKAGLPADAWKRDATFYTFQATAFGESEGH